MKKIVSLLLVLVLAGGCISFLSGCTTSGVTITVYNWGQYIADGKDGSINVNAEFTKETGIKVNYVTFSTNEELYAKLKGGASDYDIIVPSDYMVGRLKDEGFLEALDFANIPNYADIDSEFKNLIYDPDNTYSVPYLWGTVGIFYNTTMVAEADYTDISWDLLWNTKYRGEILMFDNPRDAFAIALKKLGYSMNTTNETELKAAAALLKTQKPLVQAYVMDQIFDKMLNGEAVIAPYYAGDGAIMCEENPDISFGVPKEGTNRFVDALCILKGSQHKKEAEQYINFLTRADIAAANAEYVGYATPSTKAKELIDPEVAGNENYYPSKEVLSKTEVFLTLPAETNKLMDTLWIDLKK